MSARRARRRRLLVIGAGTSTANNLIRSLRAAAAGWEILGAHHDRFALARSAADVNTLTVPADHGDFVPALRRLVTTTGADLLIPTADAEVLALAEARDGWACRLFLPTAAVTALCQDKYELAVQLQRRGVPVPRTASVGDAGGVEEAFRRLGNPPRAWCRIRRGTNSTGALPVLSAAQARAWIEYWNTMRGVPCSAFTVAEYLPGRDFACQSLWKDGQLVLVKTFERLAYITVGGNPSGVSSAAALAKTVREPTVVEVAVAAIRAVDPAPSGVFGVDLKERARGGPCVTEINAGRFLAGTTLLDVTGRHNMAATYVRLGLGEPVTCGEVYDAPEGQYMIRSVDELPRIVDADGLFRGLDDTREWTQQAATRKGRRPCRASRSRRARRSES